MYSSNSKKELQTLANIHSLITFMGNVLATSYISNRLRTTFAFIISGVFVHLMEITTELSPLFKLLFGLHQLLHQCLSL